ncbi:UNVERIFIED_CONTAM: hypothetical protein HDU68_011600 [Siphonaria sp. JEL0065]|nr:hypothetical protein HDU68_011600 [Siphonaria sp. JEL0065]
MFQSNLKVHIFGSAVVAVISLIAVIVYGALTNVETAVLKNQFLGMCYRLGSKATLLGNRIFYVASLGASLVSFICYCIAVDASSIFWNLIAISLASFGVLTLFRRFQDAPVGWESHVPTVTTLPIKILTAANIFFKWIQVFMIIFLAIGSLVQAYATNQFPPRGTITRVSMTDGRSFDMHVYCQGVGNMSLPTVWILADATHGVADFYGIQQRIVDKGRRVCTADPPGSGWSQDIISGQQDYTKHYRSLFQSNGEKTPVDLVAWGGASDAVIQFSNQHPNLVRSIVFVTAMTDLTTQSSNKAEKDAIITSRLSVARLYNGLGTPWGLFPIFTNAGTVYAGYEPVERRQEYSVQLWKAKLWVSEFWAIKYQLSPEFPDTSNLTLASSIPLTHVMCKLSDEAVCKTPGYGVSCEERQKTNRDQFAADVAATKKLQATANLVFNEDIDCDLSMPISKPKFTGEALAAALGH